MSDKVSSLVRRFGEFKPQKNGSELVFQCLDCGKWKLSYNTEKNVFHACWSCSFTVRLERKVKRFIKSFEPGKKVAEDTETEVPQISYILTTKAVKFLVSRGIENIPEGWGQRTDGRIFIPVFENGRLMCWVARAIDDQKPKELSGPNRSHFFYGYDNISPGLGVILVEGIFDAIHLRQEFKRACLALMGSSISDIQIGKLVALKLQKIVLMLDGDEAGRKATETIARKLGRRMNPMNIKKVWLADGMDPDDLTKEQFDKLMEGV